MTEEPYKLGLNDVYEEINSLDNSIIGVSNRYSRLLSALSCRLSGTSNQEAEECLTERLEIFNRYRESDSFPDNDEELLFSVSVSLWNQSAQRKHRQDHPIRGADLINMYAQSADAELADRYLQLFRDKFVSPMYDRLQIEGEDIREVTSEQSKEEVRESIINGVLLIAVWHKTYGVVIPESEIPSDDNFVMS